ncbi:MAG TPA: SURF1 family protein [Xanthomonadaceae bacterium]
MRRRILLLLLSIAVIAGFVRLGIWQLARADYKEDLLAHSRHVLEERKPDMLAAATDAPAPASEADAYEWAAGAGHFLPLPVIRLDNQVRNSVPGIRVYRVFQPTGARRAILVELGWRPLPSHQDIPPEPTPPEVTQLRGLLSPPPVAGLHLGAAAVQRQPDGSLLLVWLDPDKVAQALKLKNGLSARVLRLDPLLRFGYKRDLNVLSGTLPPEQHRGYAVQWFGMAIALLVVTIVVARRKPRRPPDEESAA